MAKKKSTTATAPKKPRDTSQERFTNRSGRRVTTLSTTTAAMLKRKRISDVFHASSPATSCASRAKSAIKLNITVEAMLQSTPLKWSRFMFEA